MNPWRAALTSATASGNSNRIASRSAIACSSTPPCGCSCASAAAVSSTAVLSVSVANCSRCASCTDSACCSANSRSPRIKSSGSPPNGNPKPPPSMPSSLAATVRHEERAEERQTSDSQTRRSGRELAGVPALDRGREDRERAEIDLDVLRHGEADRPECGEHPDRRLLLRERRRAQVELARGEHREGDRAARHTPAAPARERREHTDQDARSGALRRQRLHDCWEIRGHVLELRPRRRGVGETGAVGELLEREASGGGRVAQARNRALALGIRDPYEDRKS